MYRASNTFSVPQAVTTTVFVVLGLSLLNLLVFRFAEATNLEVVTAPDTSADVGDGVQTDAELTFFVTGVTAGTVVGENVTKDDTAATVVPFGSLAVDEAATAAQQLAVETSSPQRFAVTVQTNRQLTSETKEAVIDGYIGGTYIDVPTAWTSPVPVPGSENTYGHWGISSDDTTDMPMNFANASHFVSASTSPTTVFNGNGSTVETAGDKNTATVIYKAEVSALQEVSNDYTAQVTYVATPKI